MCKILVFIAQVFKLGYKRLDIFLLVKKSLFRVIDSIFKYRQKTIISILEYIFDEEAEFIYQVFI